MIQVRRNRDGGDEFWIDGENRSRPSLPVAASMMPGGLADLERARKLTWDDVLPGSYDPHARIKVMDEEGIDVAVTVSVAVAALRRSDRSATRGRRMPRLQQLAGGLLQGLSEAVVRRRADAAAERR